MNQCNASVAAHRGSGETGACYHKEHEGKRVPASFAGRHGAVGDGEGEGADVIGHHAVSHVLTQTSSHDTIDQWCGVNIRVSAWVWCGVVWCGVVCVNSRV